MLYECHQCLIFFPFSFNFTFDFRTYYENGLFWYLTNVDKTFYLGVQLVKGQLEVAYLYENSRVSLSFEEGLSDGLWHSVSDKSGAFMGTLVSCLHMKGILYVIMEIWQSLAIKGIKIGNQSKL